MGGIFKHVHEMVHVLYSNAYEQLPHSLGITDDLICPKLTLSEYPIHESYGHFADCIPSCTRTHHHFHLEHVSTRLSRRNDVA